MRHGGNKRFLVLMNPAAGLLNPRVKLADVKPMLKRLFGRYADFAETRSEEEARILLRRIARAGNSTRVVVAGGDGTLHNAADALCGTGVEIAAIPLGSANNVAHSLGIPVEPDAAAALARYGRARPIDAGRCGGRLFMEAAGIGFHAAVMDRYGLRRTKSLVRAVYAFSKTASELEPFQVLLRADGKAMKRTVFQLTISNLPMYGTNFRIAPGARPDDGLLDVTIVPYGSPGGILAMVAAARAGLLQLAPAVESFRCSSLIIEASSPVSAHADATIFRMKNIPVAVEKAAINIVRPQTKSRG